MAQNLDFLKILEILVILLCLGFSHLSAWEEKKYIPPPDRADIADPCAKNNHFTDPRFTCCGGMKYDAPTFYSNMKSCDALDPDKLSDKIVKSSWTVFKCMVDKVLGGKEPSFSNIAGVLMSKALPQNIQNGINDYLSKFKDYSPYNETEQLKEFEAYATAWNAYYSAENWACSDVGNKKQKVYMDDNGPACYNWIDQGTRRGDCCEQVPIPFQLYPDPIVDRYYAIKNYTAYHLMNFIAPNFDWENTTIVMYSDNIAACLRTSTLIKQGKINEDELKMQIGNLTEPDYEKIFELYVPTFLSPETRKEMKKSVLNMTAINLDYDIKHMMDNMTSIYTYVYADEWKKRKFTNENITRYLFWTCRAHSLILANYKNYDLTGLCY